MLPTKVTLHKSKFTSTPHEVGSGAESIHVGLVCMETSQRSNRGNKVKCLTGGGAGTCGRTPSMPWDKRALRLRPRAVRVHVRTDELGGTAPGAN